MEQTKAHTSGLGSGHITPRMPGAWSSAYLFTLLALRVPCALTTPAPLHFPSALSFLILVLFPTLPTWTIKIQPVLQDLRQMLLEKKKKKTSLIIPSLL